MRKSGALARGGRIQLAFMNNGSNGIVTGRIEALRRKEADIRARLAAEQLKIRRRMDRENARLFALVGEALCRDAAQNPDCMDTIRLKQFLSSAVTDERSREFLRMKGML
jgi:hypothetical protein